MRRRDFIVLLGGALACSPATSGQARGSRPLIGILSGTSAVFVSSLLIGHVEGRDYDVAVRFAEGDLSRLPALAIELVELKPDILVAANTTAAVAVRNATTTVPVVSVALSPCRKGSLRVTRVPVET
jgi:ABC-type uncharacterized transport system substrate-binding protein